MKRGQHKFKTNLTHYYPKLTPNERGLLCAAIRSTSDDYKDIHLGLLPFIPRVVAIACLQIMSNAVANNGTNRRRVYLKLLIKLGEHDFADQQRKSARFHMMLDDGLVAKKLGTSLDRGVPIPGTLKRRVTAGVKWSLPKRAYVPDDNVMVHDMMLLHPITKGMWRIECPENRIRQVELYLMDNCQLPRKAKSRKRGV